MSAAGLTRPIADAGRTPGTLEDRRHRRRRGRDRGTHRRTFLRRRLVALAVAAGGAAALITALAGSDAHDGRDLIATVDGIAVTEADVDRGLRLAFAREIVPGAGVIPAPAGPISLDACAVRSGDLGRASLTRVLERRCAGGAAPIRGRMADALIASAQYERAAAERGIGIGDEELAGYLAAIEAGMGSERRFERVLTLAAIDRPQLSAMLRAQLVRERLITRNGAPLAAGATGREWAGATDCNGVRPWVSACAQAPPGGGDR